MTDSMKAGRVRKLLKQMIPGSDTDLLTGTREARTKQTRELAGAEAEYAPSAAPSPTPSLPPLPGTPAKMESDDDGLLMSSPKKPKKKSTKGTDVPTDVNGRY